jgi:hypothetical protein
MYRLKQIEESAENAMAANRRVQPSMGLIAHSLKNKKAVDCMVEANTHQNVDGKR